MENIFCFIALLLLGKFASTTGLSCKQCDTSKCPPPPGDCEAGIVTDTCNCCFVCGKMENESCGGMYSLSGKCGDGLECVTKVNNDNLFRMCISGICKKSCPAYHRLL